MRTGTLGLRSRLPRPAVLVAFFLLAPVASAAPAEEATLTDGRRVAGALTWAEGGLRFTPSDRKDPLPLDRIQHIRFPATSVVPLHAATVHQVHLRDGQRLSGELLELNEKGLRLRTAWSAPLSIPRPALTAVTHPAGLMTFADEDFEDKLKAWKLTGEPGFSEEHLSGKRSLLLSAPGQEAEYALAEPLEAGRAVVHFKDVGDPNGAVWRIEAAFQTRSGPRVLRVTVAGGGDTYPVEVDGIRGEAAPVPRKSGWHRLALDFGAHSLRVSLDDAVLWYTLEQGPGGPLRQVRLVCRAAADAKAKGAVVFDDFSLARAVDVVSRPAGDPTQDELWLRDGDQFFGKLAGADRRTIDWKVRSGTRAFPWGDVRGLYLRRTAPPPQTTDGEHVRVWLRSGAATEMDEVEGVVRSLDDRRLIVQHPVLGELTIERDRLHQVRRLFRGQRIELDNASHHLGPEGKTVASLQPSQAEGPSLRRTFRLDTAPAEARLVLDVVQLKGPRDGLAKALERGDSLTEVVVNGQRVEYLNRHADRGRIVLPVPRGLLKSGENAVEVRQTPEKETGRYEHCGILGLMVEVLR